MADGFLLTALVAAYTTDPPGVQDPFTRAGAPSAGGKTHVRSTKQAPRCTARRYREPHVEAEAAQSAMQSW
jgi:hypothetical protein